MLGFKAMPTFLRAAAGARATHAAKSMTTHIPKFHFSQAQIEVQKMIGLSTLSSNNLMIANLRELLLKSRSES